MPPNAAAKPAEWQAMEAITAALRSPTGSAPEESEAPESWETAQTFTAGAVQHQLSFCYRSHLGVEGPAGP
jgi:hypothetical protein